MLRSTQVMLNRFLLDSQKFRNIKKNNWSVVFLKSLILSFVPLLIARTCLNINREVMLIFFVIFANFAIAWIVGIRFIWEFHVNSINRNQMINLIKNLLKIVIGNNVVSASFILKRAKDAII